MRAQGEVSKSYKLDDKAWRPWGIPTQECVYLCSLNKTFVIKSVCMLSWQTVYYYKTGLILINSILEMQSTLSVKSLSVVGFHTHTHTDTYIHTLHQVINNGESSQPQ